MNKKKTINFSALLLNMFYSSKYSNIIIKYY